MRNAIETQQLIIGHQGKDIASPIDIYCPSGKITAILGLNGAGKSTLLLTLAGLLPAISGTVLMDGRSLHQMDAPALAKLRSVVLTGRQEVVPSMTAVELFRLSRLSNTGWFQQKDSGGNERMEHVITEMHLEDLVLRPLYTLSDGEYQRIMIARALVQEAPIIFLDEPTAHLDIVQRKATFELLLKLPETFGVSLVLCTHEIDRAMDIAHHFIVVEKDKETLSGGADLVRNHPAWREFLQRI